jgi:hypothetical protein
MWKVILLVLLLLSFVGIGVAHVITPDRFLRKSGIRKGGELLTEWNRFGIQVAGAIFAGGAAYLLFILLRQLTY